MADDKPARRLTEKQRRFVEAYLGECVGNGVEAARRAGYKGRYATLASVARENLNKPQIQTALAEARENSPTKIMNPAEIQQWWCDMINDPEIPAAVRRGCARDLARSQAMFVEYRVVDMHDSREQPREADEPEALLPILENGSVDTVDQLLEAIHEAEQIKPEA